MVCLARRVQDWWVWALCLALCMTAACFESTPDPPIGGSECTAHAAFAQVEARRATILFVIDDSPSMCEEQLNTRANVAAFADALVAAWWPFFELHMGVVSTDTVDPTRRGRLNDAAVPIAATPECPSPPPPLDCELGLPSPLPKWVDETMVADGTMGRIFGCLAQVGVEGSAAETPLGAAYLALEAELASDPDANGGFLTPDSFVLIVLVSDEDDCTLCLNGDCGPLTSSLANPGDCDWSRAGELTSPEELAALIGGLDNGGKTIAENGLFVVSIRGLDAAGNSAGTPLPDPAGDDGAPAICAVPGQGSAAPAPRLEAFTRGFDDFLEYSICDNDWGASLGNLAERSASILSSICLQLPVCPGTTAADVLVLLEDEGEVRTLVPLADYELSCASSATGPCPGSASGACPDGVRLSFASPSPIPAGARVDVYYACDGGDGCTPEG